MSYGLESLFEKLLNLLLVAQCLQSREALSRAAVDNCISWKRARDSCGRMKNAIEISLGPRAFPFSPFHSPHSSKADLIKVQRNFSLFRRALCPCKSTLLLSLTAAEMHCCCSFSLSCCCSLSSLLLISPHLIDLSLLRSLSRRSIYLEKGLSPGHLSGCSDTCWASSQTSRCLVYNGEIDDQLPLTSYDIISKLGRAEMIDAELHPLKGCSSKLQLSTITIHSSISFHSSY
ncbi:hypothetical protein CKAN_02491500 [Cinnamomum micranthum f. kanehirae]|uniref:Uncharacterized protein n=1 Tax=Cinnamomum micranthum f. kanehirae TaxID=337451 RepID=A0A3S3R591_9MAGN|nr:hypothetical protein CKAN_02491500 [Cinnamomum micranthum f. kanehirae]